MDWCRLQSAHLPLPLTPFHPLPPTQARMYDQRLTFHPSHFVKLASLDDAYVQTSINELEMHSQVKT